MLKIWGRNTSSNVQKVMWASARSKLPFERIDVGGTFGKTKDPFYLAMNPNSLVPTLEEEDGFTAVGIELDRALSRRQAPPGTLEPADPKCARRAQLWMDWQLSVMGPAITPVFWGLIRTPPEKRDPKPRSRPARKSPSRPRRSSMPSSPRRSSWRATTSPTAIFRSAS